VVLHHGLAGGHGGQDDVRPTAATACSAAFVIHGLRRVLVACFAVHVGARPWQRMPERAPASAKVASDQPIAEWPRHQHALGRVHRRDVVLVDDTTVIVRVDERPAEFRRLRAYLVKDQGRRAECR
jgi:hypothetical protein